MVLAQTTLAPSKVYSKFLERLAAKWSGKDFTVEDLGTDEGLMKILGYPRKKVVARSPQEVVVVEPKSSSDHHSKTLPYASCAHDSVPSLGHKSHGPSGEYGWPTIVDKRWAGADKRGIAIILCDLLQGNTELSRMIVSILATSVKAEECNADQEWHIHRYRHLHGTICRGRRAFEDYSDWRIKWRSDFSYDDVIYEHDRLFPVIAAGGIL